MAFGNEPGGPGIQNFWQNLLTIPKAKDSRRVYSGAAG